MRLLKKNQVIVYAIAIMLMTAGYFNFTANTNSDKALETSMQIESSDDTMLADIGDATLVSSNDIVENSEQQEEKNETEEAKNGGSGQKSSNNLESEQNSETSNSTVETNTNISKEEYFIKSKLERDTMYSQILETYENVLNSANSLETQKQTATQEITKINDIKNKIMICENLIQTKGFENSVIFVNGESISVIIGTEEIKTEQVAQIQNIISREMNAKIENIHISTK